MEGFQTQKRTKLTISTNSWGINSIQAQECTHVDDPEKNGQINY